MRRSRHWTRRVRVYLHVYGGSFNGNGEALFIIHVNNVGDLAGCFFVDKIMPIGYGLSDCPAQQNTQNIQ